MCVIVSTGVRVLLRRKVLQHNRADQPDERRDYDYAKKSHEPNQRTEDQIGRSRAAGPAYHGRVRRPRDIISRVIDRFPTLDRRPR